MLSIRGTGTPILDLLVGGTRTGSLLANSSEVRLNSITAIPLTFYVNNSFAGQFNSSGEFGIGVIPVAGFKLQAKVAANRNIGIIDLSATATVVGVTDAGGPNTTMFAGAPARMSGDGATTIHFNLGSTGDLALGSGGTANADGRFSAYTTNRSITT